MPITSAEPGLCVDWRPSACCTDLRIWDFRSSSGVHEFIANSNYVASRIVKSYRRDAIVIHPPVDTEFFRRCDEKEEYYFSASALRSLQAP